MALSFDLDTAQKEFLASQAARAIESALRDDKLAEPAQPDLSAEENAVLNRDLGSFVTLAIKKNLRGCIGSIVGREPLWLNVWKMARQAAFADPRFPPLSAAEWSVTDIEITVLDQPSLCPDPDAIVIGRDGLILAANGKTGVFLPQVPVEQGWDRLQYLDHLCLKAGLPQGSWRMPGAVLYWYQALAFPARCAQPGD